MTKCTKCGNNDFQIVAERTADAKVDENGVLHAEDCCSDEELKSVQCSKCGHYVVLPNSTENPKIEWDWC